MQLDAQHSYALLVGVPSTEVPGTERVKPGDPDSSYIVLKLENAPGIVGAQMPFGGPYLPQSTIDVIRQWISDGAMNDGQAGAAAPFAVTATSPPDSRAPAATPPSELVVAFSHEVDFSLLNETTVALERLDAPQTTPVRLTLQPRERQPAHGAREAGGRARRGQLPPDACAAREPAALADLNAGAAR